VKTINIRRGLKLLKIKVKNATRSVVKVIASNKIIKDKIFFVLPKKSRERKISKVNHHPIVNIKKGARIVKLQL